MHATFRPVSWRLGACLWVVLGTSGCGGGVVGYWTGVCDAGIGVDRFDMDMHLEIDGLDGDRVEGGGAFRYNDFLFTGELKGNRDDDALDVDIVGVAGGYTITNRVLLERVGDELEGVCAMTDQDELLEGEITFARD